MNHDDLGYPDHCSNCQFQSEEVIECAICAGEHSAWVQHPYAVEQIDGKNVAFYKCRKCGTGWNCHWG